MKWHVEIEGLHRDEGTFIHHYFVDGNTQQEAARAARCRFADAYTEDGPVQYVRCQLVEPDSGVLIF